ncbi:hypothetical protein CYMTET_49744 [Cymbomonas tetramitiformis]|uniref:Uncharacterized protein n=1 Tax=Cymbomonas tetramitiformis TaxID=36881 RepID=A0AAE0ETU5_9CHLO|nr:hypothetical protein CYMTET_49744 [Cymbomonas tetramitiformis]
MVKDAIGDAVVPDILDGGWNHRARHHADEASPLLRAHTWGGRMVHVPDHGAVPSPYRHGDHGGSDYSATATTVDRPHRRGRPTGSSSPSRSDVANWRHARPLHSEEGGRAGEIVSNLADTLSRGPTDFEIAETRLTRSGGSFCYTVSTPPEVSPSVSR